ncbi:MAG: GH3 auxin-responsive promoter family protein [Rikenellaceae bacterium]|nr:GH3 auxin-responsive promoter family protein [Rikenellaceae bacterium]
MSITAHLVNLFFTRRREAIDRFRRHPAEVQLAQLGHLLEEGARTRMGDEWGLGDIRTIEQFQARVPVTDYDRYSATIDRARRGEADILWPGSVRWFAKSSGTTGAKSKYIPVTDEGLKRCHFQGPRDVICLFADLYPDTRVFEGKTLTLGGSRRIEREGETALTGDLSAILIENTPRWASLRRVPSVETALTPDFELKVRRICEETVAQNVASFAGVPSWNLVMLNKVLEYTGKQNLLEVWPNMELFIHGGMNFKPYREQYRRLIPSPDMKYMETYNASEGFFAIQDDPAADDMLLMLDYGVFYEFLPTDSLGNPSKAVPLEDVRTGVNYAMIISSVNGLWRYLIGDTVTFTSLTPYKIRITGRTKLYINAFGEEVIIENAESAVHAACGATGAEVAEYTAGPVYMGDRTKGAHEWIVEFARPPRDTARFADELDRALQRVNSDYEAKRFKDTTLMPPRLTVVPPGTFHRWMARHDKVGGQNKVPRLSNDRTYLDQLHALTDPAGNR